MMTTFITMVSLEMLHLFVYVIINLTFVIVNIKIYTKYDSATGY